MRILALVALAATVALPFSASAQPGPSLLSPVAVRESSRRVAVRFEHGLALVEIRIALETSSVEPAEVELSVPVPPDAELSGLHVCNAHGCRDAARSAPDRDAYALAVSLPAAAPRTPPVAEAAVDLASSRLVVRAAPISSSMPLDLAMRFVASPRIADGSVSLTLPAAADVAGLAPVVVEVLAPGLDAPTVNGLPASVGAPAGAAITVRAELPPGSLFLDARVVSCGGRSDCGRVVAAAGRGPSPRDALVLVDVSPSMLDVPAGRVRRVFERLLAGLPDGSVVRVATFARRARLLVADRAPPSEIQLSAVDLASNIALGNASRVDSARSMVPEPSEGAALPLVVVIGDGRLTGTPSAAIAELVRSGAQFSFVDLAGGELDARVAELAYASGGTVATFPEGGVDLDDRALDAALAGLVAPSLGSLELVVPGARPRPLDLPPLPAGGRVVWEGFVPTGARFRFGSRDVPVLRAEPDLRRGLSRRLERALGTGDVDERLLAIDAADVSRALKWSSPGRRPLPRIRSAIGPMRHGLTPSPLAPTARVNQPHWACGCCGVEIRGSLSIETIRRTMRMAEPAVRGCFRRARRGRRDFEARVLYQLVLRGREIEAATVEMTGVDEGLESCFLDALDSISIPVASPNAAELVVVRYPFFVRGVGPTERPAAPLPLDLEMALDRLAR